MSRSLLEDFVRDYLEATGGAWDEVESQVYDLLLPSSGVSRLDVSERDVLRVAFDPEALPEHPGSQLAVFGTPLVDGLLQDALDRGRFSCLYFLGLNLAPHDLASRVHRSLTLTAGPELRVNRCRAMYFPQALFWFQADFISDQKEQEVMASAVDLHNGRQMRHQEKLLDAARLADQPSRPLPEAGHCGLVAGYHLAREEVLRTLATFAHARERELRERLKRQAGRMQRYYNDLRQELATAGIRSKDRNEAEARLAARKDAVDREERLRLAELRQKNSLRVTLRLLQTLLIMQPKLLIQAALVSTKQAMSINLVWDPLMEALEAVTCPVCGKPSFALGMLPRTASFCCGKCLERGVPGGRRL